MDGVDQLIKEYELTVEELRQQQAQADSLFLSIGDGAIATDTRCHVNRINRRALEMLGLSEDEAIGKWFPRLVPALDSEGRPVHPVDRPITRAFLTGKPVFQKLRYKIGDDQWLPVAVTVSPIMLKDQPIGAIEVFRDITTDEEINRMKNEFISLASHQLRTPLTAVNTYARMLSSGFAGELTADQRKLMDTILTSVDRMNQIITALLDIAKLESGKIHVIPEIINLPKLIRSIVHEQANSALTKNISVKFNSPPGRYAVKSDPLLLKEVVANLLSNAIKYTPAGGKVTISLERKADHFLLKVKDNGYGIPAAEQQHVFTKFFRAPNILYKETVGTGLGMYLVKSIVEVLGGSIWFKSQEDKGTTFFVNLPASRRKAAAINAAGLKRPLKK